MEHTALLKRFFFPRFFKRLLSFFLSLALALPPSAHALRPTIENKVESGLEEAFKPSAGLEEGQDLLEDLSDREKEMLSALYGRQKQVGKNLLVAWLAFTRLLKELGEDRLPYSGELFWIVEEFLLQPEPGGKKTPWGALLEQKGREKPIYKEELYKSRYKKFNSVRWWALVRLKKIGLENWLAVRIHHGTPVALKDIYRGKLSAALQKAKEDLQALRPRISPSEQTPKAEPWDTKLSRLDLEPRGVWLDIVRRLDRQALHTLAAVLAFQKLHRVYPNKAEVGLALGHPKSYRETGRTRYDALFETFRSVDSNIPPELIPTPTVRKRVGENLLHVPKEAVDETERALRQLISPTGLEEALVVHTDYPASKFPGGPWLEAAGLHAWMERAIKEVQPSIPGLYARLTGSSSYLKTDDGMIPLHRVSDFDVVIWMPPGSPVTSYMQFIEALKHQAPPEISTGTKPRQEFGVKGEMRWQFLPTYTDFQPILFNSPAEAIAHIKSLLLKQEGGLSSEEKAVKKFVEFLFRRGRPALHAYWRDRFLALDPGDPEYEIKTIQLFEEIKRTNGSIPSENAAPAGLEETVLLEPLTQDIVESSGWRLEELLSQIEFEPDLRRQLRETGRELGPEFVDSDLSFVARDPESQEIVGLVTGVRSLSSNSVFMTWLAVDENSRGEGIGKQLLNGIREAAGRKGFERIGWNVFCDDVEAQEFYSRMGAYVVGSGPKSQLWEIDSLLPVKSPLGFVVSRRAQESSLLAGLEEKIIPVAQAFQFPDRVGEKSLWLSRVRQLGIPTVGGFDVTESYIDEVLTEEIIEESLDRGRVLEETAERIKTDLLPHLKALESESGLRFGDPKKPLLIAVRSDAEDPYPGLLTSVVFVGFTQEILESLVESWGQEMANRYYLHFLQSFGSGVFGIPDERFRSILATESNPVLIVRAFEGLMRELGHSIPQDPYEQLTLALMAVKHSAKAMEKAVEVYQRIKNLEVHPPKMAVLVQPMVLTLAEESGVGYFTTHDAQTGKPRLTMDLLPEGVGDELMKGSGLRKDFLDVEQAKKRFPSLLSNIEQIHALMVQHFGIPVGVEFAFQEGSQVSILQTTPVMVTPSVAANVLACRLERGQSPWVELVRTAPLLADMDVALPGSRFSRVRYQWASGERPKNLLFSGAQTVHPGIFKGNYLTDGRRSSVKPDVIFVASPEMRGDPLIRFLALGQIGGLVVDSPLAEHEKQLVDFLRIPTLLVPSEEFSFMVNALDFVGPNPYRGKAIILDAGEGKIYEYAPELLSQEEETVSQPFNVHSLETGIRQRYGNAPYQELITTHETFLLDAYERQRHAQITSLDGPPHELNSPYIYAILEASLKAHFVHELLKEKGRALGKSPEEIQADLVTSITRLTSPYQVNTESPYAIWEPHLDNSKTEHRFSLGGYFHVKVEPDEWLLVFYNSGIWSLRGDLPMIQQEEGEEMLRGLRTKAEAAASNAGDFLSYLKEQGVSHLARGIFHFDQYHKHHRGLEGGKEGQIVVGILFPKDALEEITNRLNLYEKTKLAGLEAAFREFFEAVKLREAA